MPRYHKLGSIPAKRHTIYKSKEGAYYYEELFGTIGFDGMSSLIYHTHSNIKSLGEWLKYKISYSGWFKAVP